MNVLCIVQRPRSRFCALPRSRASIARAPPRGRGTRAAARRRPPTRSEKRRPRPRETTTLCTSLLPNLPAEGAGRAAVQRHDAVDPLVPAWDALLGRDPDAACFSGPRWISLYRRFFPTGSLRILATRDAAGELTGVAPLLDRGDALELVGHDDICDYHDLVGPAERRAELVAVVLDELLGGPWDSLRLGGLPADSPTRPLTAELARRRGLRVLDEPIAVAPRVALPADVDSYYAMLSKKDRHELRRKMRRLASAGDYRWGAVPPDALAERDVDDFLRLHRLAPAKSVFMTAEMERYFRALIAAFQPDDLARLYFLEVGGARVSTLLLFDHGGDYLLYNSGYDPSYQHLSVGLLLKALTLQEAIERGRRAFDFLRGAEPYKYDLGGVDRVVHRLTIARPPSGGDRAGR